MRRRTSAERRGALDGFHRERHLIEARSCERLFIFLAEARPDARLRELYGRLAQSEAGHERLFVELARSHARRGVDARLEALAEEEARIVRELPLLPRIH